jgi:arylformamidase
MNANLDEYEIFDITPMISEQLGVWPGDQPFERRELLSFQNEDNLVLSTIQTTVHLGAHTDAPNHYHPQGKGIESRPLQFYLGECQVIETSTKRGDRIQVSDLMDEVSSKRVILKTRSFTNASKWNPDFCALSTELVDHFNEKGVRLIGIDTPSVDLQDDKDLECHNRIYNYDMAILEGVVLGQVSPGKYQLIALPLPIKDCDASPVRAVLLKEKS